MKKIKDKFFKIIGVFFIIFLFSRHISLSYQDENMIEALPQKEKTELNLEVKKIKSKEIEGKLDKEKKIVIFDFKDIREKNRKNKITIDESAYEIFFAEDLNQLSFYSVNRDRRQIQKTIKNGAMLRAGGKVKNGKLTYSIDEEGENKNLKVEYEDTPKNFYLGVLNKITGEVEKVYSTKFVDTPTTYSGAISSFNNTIASSVTFEDNGNFSENTYFHTKELSGTAKITMDDLNNNTTFRLSAIIGGNSLNDSGGNSIVEGKVTNFLQPRVETGGEKLPIKLHLIGKKPTTASNITAFNNQMHPRDTSSVIAYRSSTIELEVALGISLDLDIINAARKENSQEVTLIWDTTLGQKNQIAFPKADWRNGVFIPHSSNNRTDTVPYPTIKIIKNQVENSGTIKYETKGGEAIITSSNSEFLKGLPYKGSIKIFNTSNVEVAVSLTDGTGVSNGGTSEEMTFILSNSVGSTATFRIKYENGVPTYSLVNFTQKPYRPNESARSFSFKIEHYEESGFLRKINNVTLVVPDIDISKITTTGSSVAPKSQFTDNESLAHNDVNYYYLNAAGNLKINISDFVSGNAGEGISYVIGAYISNTVSSGAFITPKVKVKNSDEEYVSRVHFWAGDKVAPTRAYNYQYIGGNKEIGLAQDGSSSSFSFTTGIRVSITDEIILASRKVSDRVVKPEYLGSSNTIKVVKARKIHSTNEYSVPAPGTSPIQEIPYPAIEIVKDNIEASGTLRYENGTALGIEIDPGNMPPYSTHGVIRENYNISSETGLTSTQMMRGLLFKGKARVTSLSGTEISGTTETDIDGEGIKNGGTSMNPMEFTLTKNGRTARVKLRYAMGTPYFTLVDYSPKNVTTVGDFDFKIENMEESGLVRRSYSVKLMTPKINYNISYNLGSEVIFNDNGEDITCGSCGANENLVVHDGYQVIKTGNIDYGLSNLPTTVPVYFPVLAFNNSSYNGYYQGVENLNEKISYLDSKIDIDGSEYGVRRYFYEIKKENSVGFDYFKIGKTNELDRLVMLGSYRTSNSSTLTWIKDSSTNGSVFLRTSLPNSFFINMRKVKPSYVIQSTNKNVTDIRFVIGERESYSSEITNTSVNSENNQLSSTPIPRIKIVKNHIKRDVTLKYDNSYKRNTKISFNEDASYTGGTGITVAKDPNDNGFIKGLPFEGTVEFSQGAGILEILEIVGESLNNGGSSLNETELTLLGTNNNTLKLKIGYRENGIPDITLVEWTGSDNFLLNIIHKEKSGLVRRTYDLLIETPKIGELKSKEELDFGVLLKNGAASEHKAETNIVINQLSNHEVILEIDSAKNPDGKVVLRKLNSYLNANLVVEEGNTLSSEKNFILKGTISKSEVDNTTEDGSHEGTIFLNILLKRSSGVKK